MRAIVPELIYLADIFKKAPPITIIIHDAKKIVNNCDFLGRTLSFFIKNDQSRKIEPAEIYLILESKTGGKETSANLILRYTTPHVEYKATTQNNVNANFLFLISAMKHHIFLLLFLILIFQISTLKYEKMQLFFIKFNDIYILLCYIGKSNNYKGVIMIAGSDKFNDLPNGAKTWIQRFANTHNKNGSQTIQQSCSGHRPYWYSLHPRQANIITAINPFERFFFTFSRTPFTIDQRLIALSVQDGYDVELIAALLNSAITFLTLEMRGTSRNLGALDLNANYLKQLKVLNPDLLNDAQKTDILEAFQPLKHREIESIFKEVLKADRINFDKTVLRCFGMDESLLDRIYSLLVSSVDERVSMQNK